MAHLTEILRPSGDANQLWSTFTYANIDDAITSPSTSSDGNNAVAADADDSEAQRWQVTKPSGNYDSIAGVKLFLYQGNTEGDGITMSASVQVSGNFLSDQNFTSNFTKSWVELNWSLPGTPTLASFDDCEIRITADANIPKSDERQIDVAYVVVSGVAAAGGGGGGSFATYPKVIESLFTSPVIMGH